MPVERAVRAITKILWAPMNSTWSRVLLNEKGTLTI